MKLVKRTWSKDKISTVSPLLFLSLNLFSYPCFKPFYPATQSNIPIRLNVWRDSPIFSFPSKNGASEERRKISAHLNQKLSTSKPGLCRENYSGTHSKKKDGTEKDYYRGHWESLVEEALRKIACNRLSGVYAMSLLILSLSTIGWPISQNETGWKKSKKSFRR